jgi:hypothetical protein
MKEVRWVGCKCKERKAERKGRREEATPEVIERRNAVERGMNAVQEINAAQELCPRRIDCTILCTYKEAYKLCHEGFNEGQPRLSKKKERKATKMGNSSKEVCPLLRSLAKKKGRKATKGGVIPTVVPTIYSKKKGRKATQRGEISYICIAVFCFRFLIIVFHPPFFLVGGFLIP